MFYHYLLFSVIITHRHDSVWKLENNYFLELLIKIANHLRVMTNMLGTHTL
jgi:hypothetical protein